MPTFLYFHQLLNWSWIHEPCGEGSGTPLQCSCLENPRDAGTWWAAVHGAEESDMTEHLHFHFSLSCIGEGNVFLPGESQGRGSLVGSHLWFGKIPWKRK